MSQRGVRGDLAPQIIRAGVGVAVRDGVQGGAVDAFTKTGAVGIPVRVAWKGGAQAAQGSCWSEGSSVPFTHAATRLLDHGLLSCEFRLSATSVVPGPSGPK